MARVLPRLRSNLDFMPSPAPDQPGLFIRDPYRYSDAMLIVPPPLVACLECFDGRQTELDLRAALVRVTGDLRVSDIEQRLVQTLSAAGFLEDKVFRQIKEERLRQFVESPRREPAHAGTAYPLDAPGLRLKLEEYMDGRAGGPAPAQDLVGIAAPHVSPEGGWQSYRAAYQALSPGYRGRTFVILGTSHFGEPEHFGLTRKRFSTPLGESRTDLPLVDRLAAAGGPAVLMEDYCHSFEHTIEFQVLFLQHVYGPDIAILPVLCGQFARSLYGGGKPEDGEPVRRFLDALAELAAQEAGKLFWVLGIDMAHMGARYHDRFQAQAGQGRMAEVAERDRLRIECVNAGDAGGFWELVKENHDDLKWCGSAPLYTFLKAVPQARGTLLRYEQWNIDAQSVVSFAGMAFR